MEWLQSPIVYREDTSFTGGMTGLMQKHSSPVACYHHYSSMARSNYREHLKGQEVRTKKYFYVLRPVLAMIWLERDMGIVPTQFEILMEQLLEDGKLKNDIRDLLKEKRGGLESETGPRIKSINHFIERELARLEGSPPQLPSKKQSFSDLNRFFLSFLE